MIHRPWTRAQVEQAIRKRLGTKAGDRWLAEAAALNQQARKSGKLGKKTIWSRVKPAILDVQTPRCIYCEQPLPYQRDADFHGKGVSDVEHYRPKGRVAKWPSPTTARQRKIGYVVRAGRVGGYPELAHDLDNLAVSCKVCNSEEKRDAFPIAGTAGRRGATIAKLQRGEKPLLLFPVGPQADDPAEHLEFVGLRVRARSNGTRSRPSRGRVTIDFFALDDRDDLVKGRAWVVFTMYKALQSTESGTAKQRAEARRDVDLFCAREFASTAMLLRSWFRTNRRAARELFEVSREFFRSGEPMLVG